MARIASVSRNWHKSLPVLSYLHTTLNHEILTFARLIFQADEEGAKNFTQTSCHLLRAPFMFTQPAPCFLLKTIPSEKRQLAGWFLKLFFTLNKKDMKIDQDALLNAALPQMRASIDSALEMFNLIQLESEAQTLDAVRLKQIQEELVAVDRLELAAAVTAESKIENSVSDFLLPLFEKLLNKGEIVRVYTTLFSTLVSAERSKAAAHGIHLMINQGRIRQADQVIRDLLSTFDKHEVIAQLLLKKNFEAASRVVRAIDDIEEKSKAWYSICSAANKKGEIELALRVAEVIVDDDLHDQAIEEILDDSWGIVDDLSSLFDMAALIRDKGSRLGWQKEIEKKNLESSEDE